MDKRWILAIIAVLMFLLVYSFLTMVLRTDRKRTPHTRMYRDYSDYGKKGAREDSYSVDSRVYASSAEARKIQNSIFYNTVEATAISYNTYMAAATKHMPVPELPVPNSNPQYEEMLRLANRPLPEMNVGIAFLQRGDYESALSSFEEALAKLDQMELKNRMEIYGMMAECYIKLKNDDGYIQNKIRQVRLERKYKKIIMETYPKLRNKFPITDFMSTSEASKNLLRIKSSIAKLPDSPMTREMVKKAELDLEVARKVAQ